MQALLRFSAAIDALNAWIGKSAAWLGLGAVLVCTGNALARYAFHTGSNAWLELQWYLNSAVFLLIAGYALKRNEHVRIDVIVGRLSERAQAWVDLLGGLVMLLPVSIIIAWYSWPSPKLGSATISTDMDCSTSTKTDFWAFNLSRSFFLSTNTPYSYGYAFGAAPIKLRIQAERVSSN